MAKTRTISEQIETLKAAAAPSMVPEAPAPKPPPLREPERIPVLESFIKAAKTRLELARIVDRMADIQADTRPLNKEYKTLSTRAKVIAGDYGIDWATSGDYKIHYYSSPRVYIKEPSLKVALLQRGLEMDDINTIIKESSSKSDGLTLRVTKIGEKEEEE